MASSISCLDHLTNTGVRTHAGRMNVTTATYTTMAVLPSPALRLGDIHM